MIIKVFGIFFSLIFLFSCVENTSVALIFEFSLYYIDNQKYMSLFFF